MAPDTFHCPECQTMLRRPAQAASPTGAPVQVRCPRCQAQFPVPPVENEAISAAPPSPPEPAPLRDKVTEVPVPTSRPRLPEADDLDVTDEPRGGARVASNGEYEDEDYPRRGAGYIDPSELPTKYNVDIGVWFRHAWAHWSTIVGPAAGFLVIVFLTYLPGACLSVFAYVLLLLVTMPMSAGLTLVCLKQLKGERWAFGDFFGGFRHYSAFLLPNLVYLAPNFVSTLFGFVPLIVALSGGNPDLLFGLSYGVQLVMLLVSVFLQVRFLTFAWHLILDRHYNGIEALKGSWQMTQGHFWILFAVYLINGLINAGGALTLCVGMLFTMPLTALVNASGYLLIAGTEMPLERPGDAYER